MTQVSLLPIRLEFTYTRADFKAAQRVYKKSRFWRVAIIWMVVLAFIIIMLSLSSRPPTDAPPDPAPVPLTMVRILAGFCPYVGLFFILWFLCYRITRVSTAKRFYEQPVVATIFENNMAMHSPYADADYKWPYFERFGENEEVFVLFVITTSRMLLILPKRVMTAEQVVAVRALFQAHIK